MHKPLIPSDYSLSDIQKAKAMAVGFNQVAYLFTNLSIKSAIIANLTNINPIDLSDVQAAKAALAAGELAESM